MKHITRTVWVLSLVSLFTDMASEMLYPITPIYLKSIGFSVFLIGILEGFIEAIAGLSKSYFGKLSDNHGKRVPFVQLGYTLSALSKPMMGFLVSPVWIFLVRTIDRIGKGVRTGSRDALLSDESTPATKATVFGFHRSMDTLGAVIGPAFALLFLYMYPGSYKALFFIAFIPGVMAVLTTFILKDKPTVLATNNEKAHFFSFITYWKKSNSNYKKLIVGLLIFALFNSSDIFLLLKAKESGISDSSVIGLYIFYNLIYAIAAYPLGLLADKIGFKKMLLFGFILFALVYVLMGVGSQISVFIVAFFIYGIYAAATEGVSKAWITNLCEKQHTATAIGTYGGFQSICTMLASSLSGFMWYKFGASSTFFLSAFGCMIAVVYLWRFMKMGD